MPLIDAAGTTPGKLPPLITLTDKARLEELEDYHPQVQRLRAATVCIQPPCRHPQKDCWSWTEAAGQTEGTWQFSPQETCFPTLSAYLQQTIRAEIRKRKQALKELVQTTDPLDAAKLADCVEHMPWPDPLHLQIESPFAAEHLSGPPGSGSGFWVGNNTIITAGHVARLISCDTDSGRNWRCVFGFGNPGINGLYQPWQVASVEDVVYLDDPGPPPAAWRESVHFDSWSRKRDVAILRVSFYGASYPSVDPLQVSPMLPEQDADLLLTSHPFGGYSAVSSGKVLRGACRPDGSCGTFSTSLSHFAGCSGGPVLDVKSGLVVGIVHSDLKEPDPLPNLPGPVSSAVEEVQKALAKHLCAFDMARIMAGLRLFAETWIVDAPQLKASSKIRLTHHHWRSDAVLQYNLSAEIRHIAEILSWMNE